MENYLLFTNSGPDGTGFLTQKRNDGEFLSEKDCFVFGVPVGSRWGISHGSIVAGDDHGSLLPVSLGL